MSARVVPPARPSRLRGDRVTLAHGGGGRASRDLVAEVMVHAFANPLLAPLEDQARVDLAGLSARGDRLAFTTDSYVVDPLFFRGADIGSLAVNGTVNDLAVGGAVPLYLSCGMIIEEGLEIDVLRRVAGSMARAAARAGVAIVTGDTKVVPRGAADKLFVNTAGVGVITAGLELGADRARPRDAVIVNGMLGDHGTAILEARGDLALSTAIESDCQPLNGLITELTARVPGVHCLRDATRGGLATVLNEFADASGCLIELDEERLPVREEVRGFCEILGLDPLYLGNEGKLVCVVADEQAERALAVMRGHEAGRDAALVGRVCAAPHAGVVMTTRFGGRRMVDMLAGEQLPRIC